ncbi:MAG: hypothetical protein JJU11_13040 [Candidatus Sumerlaeia bacterium]|nr:hypothetical protein [Candidatus Sumerlaeia bacterium]
MITRRLILRILPLLLLLAPGGVIAGKVQVVLVYDEKGIEVLDVAPIPSMSKEITAPGLVGAPALIRFDVDWLDGNGKSMGGTVTEVPLVMRAPMGMEEAGPCQALIMTNGLVVLRMDGPDDSGKSATLRLYNGRPLGRLGEKQAWPEPFQQDRIDLVLPLEPPGESKEGPIGHDKVHDSGPDGNRFVFVILGDGYTQENLDAGIFDEHVEVFLEALRGREPWGDYMNLVNVYQINVVSNEEGADNIDGPDGPLVDTYFNTAFWSEGIERLLAPNIQGWGRAALAANQTVGVGMWDQIVLLVNTTKYGGSGGNLAVGTANEWAPEIILHELGHSVAGLADEYSTPYPGYPPGDREPNVSFAPSGAGLKWLPWVEEGTPLPTPDTEEFNEVVGSFEGARYLEEGIYRPWRSCLMRTSAGIIVPSAARPT